MHSKFFHLLSFRSVQHFMLILLGFALYFFTLNYPFVFDDRIYILGNPLLADPNAFLKYFELDEFIDVYLNRLSYPDLATSFILRPLAYLSFHVNYLVGGASPAGYRLVNIAIHIANALLLNQILQSIINHRTVAAKYEIKIAIPFFASLLFLVHPLQMQSVTFITQRFTSFVAFFYLTSILLYIQSRIAANTAVRKWYYAGSIIALIAGLLTKESVITLPFTLIMIDTILLRKPWRESVKRLAPHIVCIGLVPFQVLRIAQELRDADQLLNSATDIVGGVYSRADYAITQLRAILSYLRLLVLPYNQNFDPDYPLYRSLLNAEIIISIFIWSAVVVAGLRLLRRQERSISTDLTAFSIFWFPLAISVSSSFIPLTDLMFEHRSYLPSVAFFTGSVAYLNHLVSGREVFHKNAAICGLCLVALVFSGATVQRNQVYSSRISLLQDTVRKSPNKARPYCALGNAYLDKKRYDEAVDCYDKALDLNQNYLEVYLSLGTAFLEMGMAQRAVDLYEEYLDIYPSKKRILMNLALAYSKLDKCSEAIDCLKLTLHANDSDAGVLGFLAELKYRNKQYEKSQYYLSKARKADLEDPTIDLANMIYPLEEQLLEKVKRSAGGKS